MLKLSKKIVLDRNTIMAPNLTDRFSDEDLQKIGQHVWEGYDRDEQSRTKWRMRTQAAMDLAMQVTKEKNFPWAGCSNVTFPLVTIATLQFHSRAYPAIINTPDIVKYKVIGDDPTGELKARADRVSRHMSFQCLEEDTAWEEQHDRLLINLPIVGCAFKKTYYDGTLGHNVSELVLAQDLVLDYYAKSTETAPRKTHIIPMFRNDVYERVAVGTYRDILEEPWYTTYARPLENVTTARTDQRHGQTPPVGDEDTPFTFLEQCLYMDLDGDGYREPYIATIEYSSRCLVRLACGIDSVDQIKRTTSGRIQRIEPTQYYTKYTFIPSPDNGIYDVGFGMLLGSLNESVNSLLNQLIDAGTMSNSAGGFLGRGAKIRGGAYTFAPLEWKRVDSTGDDLKKSIFPLPVREPSNVLFQLLGLLIDYTNRISGATETLAGENPGQNTPAETTQTMVEQGMKIYAAIFKRVWRSMKEEFKKQYIVNRLFIPDVKAFGPNAEKVLRDDYMGDENRIVPSADPNVVSEKQKLSQATMIKQVAATTPGYNLPEVERQFLRALRVDNIEQIYPGPDKVPPLPNPKVMVEQLKVQAKNYAVDAQMKKFALELMEQHELNAAKILQLEAQAAKLLEEAGGVSTANEIASFKTAIDAMRTHNDAVNKQIELMMKSKELANESQGNNGPGVQ